MSVSTVTIPDHYTTIEAARLLGLAVRSVQLMVDRGELQAWKTPGGHRRIARESVERWLAGQAGPAGDLPAMAPGAVTIEAERQTARTASPPHAGGGKRKHRVLLIEDSAHFQKLVALLVQQRFPDVELRVADDGIAGLAMYGQWQPEVLIVDILLPGIDGAALITSLRTHEQFRDCRLIVVTSLAEADRAPYAFALQGVPLVHKPRLVADLPPLLQASIRGNARPPG
jgi:excisionase family DNA binding protein